MNWKREGKLLSKLAGTEIKIFNGKKREKNCQILATVSLFTSSRQNHGFSIETQEYCGKPIDERRA